MNSYKYLFLLILLVVCISNSGCKIREQQKLKTFSLKLEKAKEMLNSEDFEGSEKSYFEALIIAEEIKWTDGVVMTKRDLGKLHILRKDFKKADQNFNEAKDICIKSTDCSVEQLRFCFDFLIFFYLYNIKDLNKVDKIIDEMFPLENRFGGKAQLKVILIEYADAMKEAGFDRRSNDLLNKIN